MVGDTGNFWQWFERLSNASGIISFCIGLPIIIATYYQAYRTRQEAHAALQPPILSENCVEFVLPDGTWINLVPLQSFHTLPVPGSVVLLPGDQMGDGAGVYRVETLEYIYATEERDAQQPRQARLTKAVAQVTHLLDAIEPNSPPS
jgi:hypothetical protein